MMSQALPVHVRVQLGDLEIQRGRSGRSECGWDSLERWEGRSALLLVTSASLLVTSALLLVTSYEFN